jgi:hypothetical protein
LYPLGEKFAELGELGQCLGLRANARTFLVTFVARIVQHTVDALALVKGKPLRDCWHFIALSAANPL